MNAEIPDANAGPAGTVYYDAGCGLCSAVIRRFGRAFERRGFVFCPMQTERARQRLNLQPGELPDEMKLILPGGEQWGGMNAMVFMARRVWWLWFPAVLLGLPGMRMAADQFYRHVARNRRCLNGMCQPAARRHRTVRTFLEMP